MSKKSEYLLSLVVSFENELYNQLKEFEETGKNHQGCDCPSCQIYDMFVELPVWEKWYAYFLYAKKIIRQTS